MISTFWYSLELFQQYTFYLLNHSKSPSFHGSLQFWKQEKLQEAKSDEYGGLGMIAVLLLVKKKYKQAMTYVYVYTKTFSICQKQTRNTRKLTMSIYVVDVCTNITKQKI